MKILVIDVGGTNVKVLASGHRTPRKIPSGPKMTPKKMTRMVQEAVADWEYDAVSIGYPGPIKNGKPAAEPWNLGRGWVGFNYARAFGCPVRIVNDAVMQALGGYKGGRMLFLGLGTGLGSTLIADGVVVPMELAHLPYKNGRTFEEYVGRQGLERFGRKKWRRHVEDVIERFRAAFVTDDIVLGGGNAKLICELPKGVRSGRNGLAFVGGQRLWSKS
jgi:predicted NBD/HSP70 family sugar kinase